MKIICLLACFAFIILHSAFGQGGTWTWISGDSTLDSHGVYGTQGMPSVNNHPPGEYEPIEWKDKQGNFWIYGGTYPNIDDLWKYSPFTNEWTWVKGDSTINKHPVYGIKGVASPLNNPGSRAYCAATWVDTTGNFWLLGTWYSDLWKYDISTNMWTWVNGDTVWNAAVHGVQGVPSPLTLPGLRNETCSAWTDSLNNLWIFGGSGKDDSANFGFLNDLCKYDIATDEWTWMKGSRYMNASPNYGTIGIPDPNNDPGGRNTYTKWKDLQGNFWIYGGWSTNDLWKYDLNTNQWTCMFNSNNPFGFGNYHKLCEFDTSNVPDERYEHRSAVTDNQGRFWMFGGGNGGAGADNDLWVFDSKKLQWNWIISNGYEPYKFGTKGVPSSSNMPYERMGAVAWWGNDNKFYLFGGYSPGVTFCDLWVYTPDTNCISMIIAPPTSNFTSNITTLCENNCVNFWNLSTNSTSWQWHFAGAIDSTSIAQNPQNVCYRKAGIYNVRLIASNSGGSDTLTLTNYIYVKPNPPVPLIKQSGTTLYFHPDSTYTSYQWYDSATLIQGATDTALVITHGGNYNVKVKNGNGCSIAGGINITGIEEFTVYGLQFTISPNPTEKELRIRNNEELRIKELVIYNILGMRVYSFKPQTSNLKQETIIDVSSLAPGIYFVQIVNDNGNWTGRFVKSASSN